MKEIGYAHILQRICILADQGVIPPFGLEYQVITQELLKKYFENQDAMQGNWAESGRLRVYFLMAILDEDSDDNALSASMDALLCRSGDWGHNLGREFLQAPIIPERVKLMAAQMLVQAGVFAEGEEIPLVVDGQRRTIKIAPVHVNWEPGPESIAQYNKALKLREQGKTKDAIALLNSLTSGNLLFPPAVLVLANLYRSDDNREEAKLLLNMLESIAPDHPIFLYNLAGFWLEEGDRDKAKVYCDRIDLSDANHEFREKVKWMREAIEEDVDRRVRYFQEVKRIEIEEKKLPMEPTIARGLRNMPVQWVRSACEFWDVGCEYRKDGVAGLVEAIGSAANLRRAVLRLPGDERALLKYLVEKGGYARVSAVTRKFGSMEGDGFLGERNMPRSALGRLWLKSFVFVGRTLLHSRNEKIVAVPVEIRKELGELLE